MSVAANGGASVPWISAGGNTHATDGGGEGSAGGGGGRVFIEGTSSFINNGSATNTNITATGGQSQAASGTPRHGDDGTVRVVRPQVSSLNFTSGTLTIDAGAGEITHSDGSFLLGEFTDKTFTAGDGTTYDYQLVTFTADAINLGSGVVVNVTGDNPISPRTRNNGSLTIGTTIDVSGGAGTESPNTGGIGIAGGFNGGNVDVDGQGPGRGKGKSVVSGFNEQGGGAAYGGRGYDNDSAYSLTYGDADIADHLLGGSGGGGGDLYPGGAGGGAVEVFAHGDGVLTISGSIKANGGILPASMPRVAEVVRVEVFVWKVVQYRFPVVWKLKEVMGYPPLLVGVVVLPLNQMVMWHWVPSHWMDTAQVVYISPEPHRLMRSTFQVEPLLLTLLMLTGTTRLVYMAQV